MEIIFATGNSGKVEEMQPIFEDTDYSLKQQPADIEEIDALDVKDVAKRKARDAAEALEEDFVLVEDTGFYVEGLNGFPGAKASFFDYTCGAENLLKLLDGKENRKAYFKTAVALYHEGEVEIFTGKMTGEIPEKPRGEAVEELPYNSIIVPDHGDGSTLAENPELKDENFMRVEATEKFIDWLKREGL
ncbi:non-canonical purine NTP pyrophosphatase [Candidatus Nanohalovita haloferacivicina]|uniref:non-canonical purine NTP pyrophosphatase n=1 Tax=Candidatus Nanohalovita haloferacivicina TaxID=2978046 RepID=UPI00325FCC2B|nr:XTP/dITP diphosphohydrolase [Candidatus Nanohalobia archaeon BNXNv]